MATTKKAIAEAEQAAEIKETTATPTTEPEAPAVTLDELEGMDMNMFDAEETESAPRPVWRITDDGCADWACQKIAEEKAELRTGTGRETPSRRHKMARRGAQAPHDHSQTLSSPASTVKERTPGTLSSRSTNGS